MERNRFYNLGLKLSAGVLAIILWTYIWGDRMAHNEIQGELIQREFDSIPLAILEGPLPALQITLDHVKVSVVTEGEKTIIEKIDKDDLVGYLDVRGLEKGSYHLPPAWKLPEGIKIIVASPEFIVVTLEDRRLMDRINPIVEPVPPKIEGGGGEAKGAN